MSMTYIWDSVISKWKHANNFYIISIMLLFRTAFQLGCCLGLLFSILLIKFDIMIMSEALSQCFVLFVFHFAEYLCHNLPGKVYEGHQQNLSPLPRNSVSSGAAGSGTSEPKEKIVMV
jgi:hypothetical protein